jgi:micrococcal nuclease
MQLLRTVSLAAVAAVQIFQPPERSQPVLVTAVFDGDTVDVAGVGHVRLLGIDAPELGRGFDTAAPFASEARERLSALVLRHWIVLEYEGAREDVYQRKLAYLLLADGTDVNAVMLREGLARVTARVPLSRLDELRQAEKDAQAARRGMWRDAPDPGAQAPSTEPATVKKTSAKARPKPATVSKKTPKPKVVKVSKKKKKDPPYSARSATSGSTRVARRAGSRHAAIATAVNTAVMTPNVTGSRAVMSTRSVLITLLRKNAPSRPSEIPSVVWNKPRFSTSHDTWPAFAPSAIRTPISDVRCVTEYAITA